MNLSKHADTSSAMNSNISMFLFSYSLKEYVPMMQIWEPMRLSPIISMVKWQARYLLWMGPLLRSRSPQKAQDYLIEKLYHMSKSRLVTIFEYDMESMAVEYYLFPPDNINSPAFFK